MSDALEDFQPIIDTEEKLEKALRYWKDFSFVPNYVKLEDAMCRDRIEKIKRDRSRYAKHLRADGSSSPTPKTVSLYADLHVTESSTSTGSKCA